MRPAANNHRVSRGALIKDGTTLASIALTSTVGGDLPYTFGHVFAKGAVPQGRSVAIDNAVSQCDIQNRWDDGSAKIAVMSVRSTLVAHTPKILTLRIASPGSGAAISEANLAGFMAGKLLTVQLTGIGAVNLSDLIGTRMLTGSVVSSGLVRTRISGPLMSEFHYTAPINKHLRMFLYVRAYADRNVWVRWVIHNGYLKVAGATNFVYTLVVTANGVEKYNASVDQKHHTRITGKRWLGVDPWITPKHDGQYMSDAKLMPNYGWKSPTERAYTGLVQTYTPMGHANLRASFGGTGYDDQIGLFPRWEALYVTVGDPRAYNCTIASAESTGSYSTHYLDENTLRPLRFSKHPTLWMQTGDSQSVASATGGTAFVHDREHQVSIGYLAYLLTGDWYFIEEAQLWATYNGCFQSYAASIRHGADCLLKMAARGVAWSTRTLAGAAVITPDDDALQTEFANSFAANARYREGTYVTGTVAPTHTDRPNNLGVHSLYSGGSSGDAYTPNEYHWVDAPWMQHFMIQSYGFCWDIEVPRQTAVDRTAHKAIRDFGYKHVVGMLGNASGRPYPMAGVYGVLYGTTPTRNEQLSDLVFYSSWAEEWAASKIYYGYDEPDSSPGAPLLGNSGGNPAGFATGYWGNLYPAIAYAVEHEAPGALDAYTRLTTASNYHPGVDTFNNTPQFGIVPRSSNSLPDWVPPVGAIADVSLNTINDVRGSDPNVDYAMAAWSGMAYSPEYGEMGSFLWQGGGHTDGAQNAIYRYDIAARLYTKIKASAPVFYNSNFDCADTNTGWMWADATTSVDALNVGESFTAHFYDHFLAVPSNAMAGNAPNGWLFLPGHGGMAKSIKGTKKQHRFALGMTQKWEITGDEVLRSSGEGPAIYDPLRKRVYTFANGPSNSVHYVDMTTGAVGYVSVNKELAGYYCTGAHLVADDLIGLIRWRASDTPKLYFRLWDLRNNTVFSPTTIGVEPVAKWTGGWNWAEAWRTMIFYPGRGNVVSTLKAPAGDPRIDPWTWGNQTLTGTATSLSTNPHYSRFRYVEAIDCCLWMPKASAPIQAFRLARP